jgi:hypothetical protein
VTTLKILRISLASSAMALAVASAFAQPAMPPAPDAPPAAGSPEVRPPPEPRGPRARPPVPRPVDDSAIDATVSGRVVRWLPNPNGDVEGLLLDDGTQVAFAPVLASRLVDGVKLQDRVQVLGRRGAGSKVIRASQIKLASNGQTIAVDAPENDAPPARPPAPGRRDALTAMTTSGRIATLLYTDRGDADGVLMDNGAAVRFPPHVGAQLASELKVGGTLYARGYGTRNAQGEAFEATRIGTTESNAHEVFPARPPIDGATPPDAPR